MTWQVRTTDVTVGICDHGFPCCPHYCTGYHVTGSEDTLTNDLKSVRAPNDISVHTCPHCGINLTVCGSHDVLINDLKAHRLGDCETEICGIGISVTGSMDTKTND